MISSVISKLLVRNLIKSVNSDARIMSQRSILSFFKKQTISTSTFTANVQDDKISSSKNDVAEVNKEVVDPPVVKKKRKRINVGSDSEEEVTRSSPEKKKLSIEPTVKISPKKKLSTESTIKTSPKKKLSTESTTKTSPKKKLSIESTTKTSPKKKLSTESTIKTSPKKKLSTESTVKTSTKKKLSTDSTIKTSPKKKLSTESTVKTSPKKKLSTESATKTSPVKELDTELTNETAPESKPDSDLTNGTSPKEEGPKKRSKSPVKTPETKSTTDNTPLTNGKSPPEKKIVDSKTKTPQPPSSKKRVYKKSTKTPSKSPAQKKSTTEKTKLTNGSSSPDRQKLNESTESKDEPSSPKKEKDTSIESSKSVENKNKTASVFLISKTSSANESNIEYFPDKKNYHPIEDAPWKRGEKVPYLALAKTLQKIEEITARLKIVEILSNYFRSVIVLSPDDLLPSVYLCLNKLAPAYEGLELGIADMYLMKAIAQCTGRTNAQIKADVASTGDLGIVAEKSRSNQRIMFRPAPLTVQSVFNQLTNIANISGQSAMTKKVDKIEALFVACRECEARFVIRSLAGKMRIGLAEQSVLQALALACAATPPNQEYPPEILNASKGISADEFKKKVDEEALILKTTFCECPNYNMIIPVLLKDGIKALPEQCKITPGQPVKPMLAQPTKGAREVLERFEGMKFTCEWKYDGERAQIHLTEDGTIKIYSRNQENNTSKYPDIIENIKAVLKPEVKSFILDTEAVAWDREQEKIMPFQVLSTRKRKDADRSEIKVQVCVFMFDLLYFNGTSLVQKPLIERRVLLKENFVEVEGKFMHVTSIDTNTMEEVQECLEESVKGNCEGLMVKTLDTEATYEIAKRSRNWLKLKKDYLDGVGDTLDLVVIGGYTGKGKRTGNYGGFLLASYDSDNEEYQAICKIGTGFSDEILAQHTEFLKQHIIPAAKPYYRCDSNIVPDHWFDAVQVWEVKCADLSLSPIYHAAIGLVDPEKGISLRFPRFLRIRDDKTVEQATSSQQVAELYRNQDQIKNQTSTNTFNEEDF